MKRTALAILALEVCAASCLLGQMAGMAMPDASAIPVTRPSNVTFTRDVAPIVQQHCQGCHRPGEGAPFSMLTYEDARPWATAMKRMVVSRAMPPWFEDGHTEKFENNRSLSQAQIDTIAAWVDAGAPKGDPLSTRPLCALAAEASISPATATNITFDAFINVSLSTQLLKSLYDQITPHAAKPELRTASRLTEYAVFSDR